MPTDYHTFCALPVSVQCHLMGEEGAFLCAREQAYETIFLYRMPGGFFAELHFDSLWLHPMGTAHSRTDDLLQYYPDAQPTSFNR